MGLFICLFVCLFVCLFSCLFISSSLCLFVSLSKSLTRSVLFIHCLRYARPPRPPCGPRSESIECFQDSVEFNGTVDKYEVYGQSKQLSTSPYFSKPPGPKPLPERLIFIAREKFFGLDRISGFWSLQKTVFRISGS